MAKGAPRTVFFCRQCGNESAKWLGRCPDCGEWNSFVEGPRPSRQEANGAHAPDGGRPQELSTVQSGDVARMVTPSREVNRVLGGGLVRGSLVLVGGDPGIGKSTLLLQVVQAIAGVHGPALYVSGEESPQQVRLRADRLGIDGRGLLFLAETEMEKVLQAMDEAKPSVVVIDSIQTMFLSQVDSVAGSVSQVRECTLRLMRWAKARGTPVMIAGHVTKEGAIAGPRLLEHMVDVVLYLEGEDYSSYRVLRGVKNRFGSTNEVGIFEMRDAGLVEVANPSAAFLEQRRAGAVGSAIVAALEGTRPLLVEVQALVTPTNAPTPRRTANGVDFNRLVLICAVLTKHTGLSLANQDVVVNVTGGLRIAEPAADLGVAAAIVSSIREIPVRGDMVAIGEIGLTGELRSVNQLERRLAESEAMGFRSSLVPAAVARRHAEGAGSLELLGASGVREALRIALPDPASLRREHA